MTRGELIGLGVGVTLLAGAFGALLYAFLRREGETTVEAPKVTAARVEETLSYDMEVEP